MKFSELQKVVNWLEDNVRKPIGKLLELAKGLLECFILFYILFISMSGNSMTKRRDLNTWYVYD